MSLRVQIPPGQHGKQVLASKEKEGRVANITEVKGLLRPPSFSWCSSWSPQALCRFDAPSGQDLLSLPCMTEPRHQAGLGLSQDPYPRVNTTTTNFHSIFFTLEKSLKMVITASHLLLRLWPYSSFVSRPISQDSSQAAASAAGGQSGYT